MEVLLVRHGRTAWNATRRFLGRTDVPLDAVGVDQAVALRDQEAFRGVDAVYASPLERALATARALTPAPRVDPDLVEMDQGLLEGLEGPEAIRRHPAFFQAWTEDPASVTIPGGESLATVQARGLAALRRIAGLHPPGARVVAVSHQMVVASVTAHLAGAPLGDWRRFAVGNTGWWRLRWHADHVEVLEGAPGIR